MNVLILMPRYTHPALLPGGLGTEFHQNHFNVVLSVAQKVTLTLVLR
jgi:hypothetical protein